MFESDVDTLYKKGRKIYEILLFVKNRQLLTSSSEQLFGLEFFWPVTSKVLGI